MWHDYPYTDAHELNLDWFLAKFKEYYEHITEQDQKITTMEDTVEQFTSFVTNYFDNLDVQQEINNKLDAMAASGELQAMLQPYFDHFVETVDSQIRTQNQRINTQDQRINTLDARMDEFSTLTDGSTTGDAELADIRVGNDGTVYTNAGTAVRTQVDLLQDQIDDLTEENGYTRIVYGPFKKEYIDLSSDPVSLTPISGANNYKTAVINCQEGDVFMLNILGGNNARAWAFLDADDNRITVAAANANIDKRYFIAPPNAVKLVLNNMDQDTNSYKLDLVKCFDSLYIPWYSNLAIGATTGISYSSTTFKASSSVPCIGLSSIWITMPIYTPTGGSMLYGIAFYDTAGQYVDGVRITIGTNALQFIKLDLPEGAASLRTTMYDDSYTNYTPLPYGFKLMSGTSFEAIEYMEHRYSAPEFPHYNTLGSFAPYIIDNTSSYDFTVTLQNLYDKMDSFVTQYPDLIKRNSDIGMDASETYELRHYTIQLMKPAVFTTRSDSYIRDDSNNLYSDTDSNYIPRRLLLTMGMHSGTERNAIKGSLAAIEAILTSNEDWASFLLNNFIIDIVPCINPWGLVNGSANNYNNVNINRDFINLTQPETVAVKNLVDSLVLKGLIGVVDTHLSTVGGSGYWVTKTAYKYYNNYIRMSQFVNRMITPLMQAIYGNNYNGIYFYCWNYAGEPSAKGQLHEYVNSIGLLGMSCEARTNTDSYKVIQMIVPNVLSLFGTFEN